MEWGRLGCLEGSAVVGAKEIGVLVGEVEGCLDGVVVGCFDGCFEGDLVVTSVARDVCHSDIGIPSQISLL